MSSAFQTFSSPAGVLRQPHLHATYALEMMRAIAPSIDKLSACLVQGTNDSSRFSATAQIMDLQQTLAESCRAIKERIPEQMLREGGEHLHFISTNQRSQGIWIKDTYELLVNIGERIRSGYRLQEDPITLRNELLSSELSGAPSLPRLMRALANSSHFTSLSLNSPDDRASLGI